MYVKFWGTRGSIPQARPDVMHYGGNTACIEIRSAKGTLVVIDCGSGSFALGRQLMRDRSGPLRGTLLFSHTHWDHIQGFPFFQPLFDPHGEWNIFGPQGLNSSLKETLAGQMQYEYFPITPDAMASKPSYHDLVEGRFEIDDIVVQSHYLDHPALTLGYRLEVDGAVAVYACDHEPVSRMAEPGERELRDQERAHIEFLQGADLVIHDCQFTAEEYPSRTGWGHSTPEYALAVASAAQVRKLALTHHDPARDDDQIHDMIDAIRAKAALKGSQIEISAAREGMIIELESRNISRTATARTQGQARATEPAALQDCSILLAPLRPEARKIVLAAAANEGIEVREAQNLAAVKAALSRSKPAALMLDCEYSSALLREIAGLESVPRLIMVDDGKGCASDYGLSIGRWMTWPFTEAYAQTAIKACSLRQDLRWKPAAKPENEADRTRQLDELAILDTPKERRFDDLTSLTAAALSLPMALINFIDRDRQWIKSSKGIEIRQTPRDAAFCAHTILQDDVFVVEDALADERFADNPLVTPMRGIRFYAGCPLRPFGNLAVGSLCVIDSRPRAFSSREREVLRGLAKLVERELERPAFSP